MECDSEPVRNSKFRFVWFVKLRLMRSLICRERVTRPVSRIERGGILDRGDDRQAMVVAVAREIAQRHARREIVLDARRVAVGVDVVEVDIGDAVEVVLVDVTDRRRRGRKTGQCR